MEQTGGAEEAAGERVDHHLEPRGGDAAEARGGLVGTKREHVPPEHRVAQHHGRRDRQCGRDPHARRQRVAEGIGGGHPAVDGRGVVIDRLVVGQPLGRAARHPERAERDDERHEPQGRDRRAVEQADQPAGEDHRAANRHRPPALLDEQRADHARQRDARARREVDATSHDDERHAQRADRHDHRLREDDLEIVVGEEELPRLRRDCEERDDHDEPEERARLGKYATDGFFHDFGRDLDVGAEGGKRFVPE